MLAAELPEHLLAAVLQLVLEQAPTSWQGPFREASGLLRLAVQLSTVCRSWRQAAAHAVTVVDVRPNYYMPPQYLSSLLGHLVAGCNAMELSTPLLASSQAPQFLEIAQPGQLLVRDRQHFVGSSHQHNAAVGKALARCSSVRVLTISAQLQPTAWPPNLQSLKTGCLWHLNPAERLYRATSLLQSLQGLSCLAQLTLGHFAGLEAILAEPDCFAGLTALRELTVHLNRLHAAPSFSTTSLSAAASHGVHVGISLELSWSSDALPTRLALWAGLADCSNLSRLHIRTLAQAPISSTEQQLMAAISCSELVLYATTLTSVMPAQVQALLGIRSELLYCALSTFFQGTLDCSLLAARPGIYVACNVRLTGITGCPAFPPAFAQGWAVVLLQSSDALIQNLPGPCIVPGPQGHLVWRNSHVTDAMLIRAYKLLNI